MLMYHILFFCCWPMVLWLMHDQNDVSVWLWVCINLNYMDISTTWVVLLYGYQYQFLHCCSRLLLLCLIHLAFRRMVLLLRLRNPASKWKSGRTGPRRFVVSRRCLSRYFWSSIPLLCIVCYHVSSVLLMQALLSVVDTFTDQGWWCEEEVNTYLHLYYCSGLWGV